MPPEERDAVADLAADVLALSADDRHRTWGAASPPGRYAATVVRVFRDVGHRYQEQAAASGVAEVGVKVFKTTSDARHTARHLLPFHQRDLSRLPGLPNPRVQCSLAAGMARDGRGEERAYVVQQWVSGDTLEDLLRRRWKERGATGACIRSILEQLVMGIIIPLWGEGTVWWDVRDGNYCYDSAADRLTLIDVDSLAAYADEILHTPHAWARRDKGRATALARLRQMTLRLLRARDVALPRSAAAAVGRAWEAELVPALSRLGKTTGEKTFALAAWRGFIDRLEQLAVF
jgi:hypothetical protein